MNKILPTIFFGLLFIMSMFMLIPETGNVNLTDQGTFLDGSFNVDTDWTGQGTLTGDMQTDNEIIYTGSNQQGTWTSRIIEGEQFNVINFDASTDPLNGDINYTINLWDNGITTTPDKTYTGEINDAEFTTNLTGLQSYNSFEVIITIDETSGSNNQRPNVNSLNVDYVENLDREGLGLEGSNFQLFVLMAFIGMGLLGLIKEVVN